jgi:hypothetical protein
MCSSPVTRGYLSLAEPNSVWRDSLPLPEPLVAVFRLPLHAEHGWLQTRQEDAYPTCHQQADDHIEAAA